MSSLNVELVVTTPTGVSVLTSHVCLKCPVEISGRIFIVDLICLPLDQIDVILGMDWLSSNRVLLNCSERTIEFDELGVSRDKIFVSSNQVATSLKENAQVYMIVANLEVENQVALSDVPVVGEFPEVFPEDIASLPPKREVEFP